MLVIEIQVLALLNFTIIIILIVAERTRFFAAKNKSFGHSKNNKILQYSLITLWPEYFLPLCNLIHFGYLKLDPNQ